MQNRRMLCPAYVTPAHHTSVRAGKVITVFAAAIAGMRQIDLPVTRHELHSLPVIIAGTELAFQPSPIDLA